MALQLADENSKMTLKDSERSNVTRRMNVTCDKVHTNYQEPEMKANPAVNLTLPTHNAFNANKPKK